jgi:hypothetical protein
VAGFVQHRVQVVEQVHLAVAYARGTLLHAVPVVVAVGDAKPAFVGSDAVAAAHQAGLVVGAEVVPRNRHQVGLAGDVQEAIVPLHAPAQAHGLVAVGALPVVEGAVVHPDAAGVAQREGVVV